MIAVDVGNTNTSMGWFQEGRLQDIRSFRTNSASTAAALELHCAHLGKNEQKNSSPIDLMISSVVPAATKLWTQLGSGWIVHIITANTPRSFDLTLKEPDTMGADRLVNIEGALRDYGAPVIVVDAGTGITVDALDENRCYRGGVIAPGLRISTEALFSRAARLDTVPLEPADSVLARTTKTALEAGVFFGFAGLVDRLIEETRREMGSKDIPTIVTGGTMGSLLPLLRQSVVLDSGLTLKGIYAMYENVSKGEIRHA